MASGRQVEYSLKLNSNASSVLMADAQAANKFDNSMWQVQKTLASFGLGLGAHYLIDAAKDWTQAAADYEQAMLRIKNVSGEGLGVINQNFINSQVDNFKLKLQESADAYGNFLFKIKNAHLSNDVSNRLFENLNVVSKVAGIPQEQMDATIRNLGIMLGEGVLEARHLRMLSYVHPQIVPYLAEALGLKSGQIDVFNSILHGEDNDETAQQKLSLLISSGKLTKLALNSNVLIEAFEKYREAIEGKLPETLTLLQSQLNDLSNTWLRFKNSFVLGDKPELVELFNSVKDAIKWLTDHEEGLLKIGKAVFEIVKLYAEWRIALMALQAPFAIVSAFGGEYERLNSVLGLYNTNITSSTALTDAETVAITNKAAALEALAVAYENVGNANSWRTAGGLYDVNNTNSETGETDDITHTSDLYAKRFGINNNNENINQNSSPENTVGDEIPIIGFNFVTWIVAATYALDRFTVSMTDAADGRKKPTGWDVWFPMLQIELSNSPYWVAKREEINEQNLKIKQPEGELKILQTDILQKLDKLLNVQDLGNTSNPFNINLPETASYNNYFPYKSLEAKRAAEDELKIQNSKKISKLEDHKLRGNSSNYFTVHIDTLNGIQKVDIKEASKNEIENIKAEVGVQIARNLTEIINDVQLIRNGH